MINHISFDLWGTLLKSNPEYRYAQAQYYKEFVQENLRQEVFDPASVLKAASTCADTMIGYLGIDINPLGYAGLALAEQIMLTDTAAELVHWLKQGFQEIAISNPPALIHADTIEILVELKEKGKTLSVGSNTGYIESKTMFRLLRKLGINHLFDFHVFSDTTYACKPRMKFFKSIRDQVGQIPAVILHVGDTNTFDVYPAKEYGFQSFLVDKDYPLENLLEL